MGKERFEFGKNWKEFLDNLSEERIEEAEKSLREWLGVKDLQGKSFLDIGSGSGLFSLAARNLGAAVFSFDYDENSVACTEYLKKRFYLNDEKWTVEKGDILNLEYLSQFNKYDIVYSWGVCIIQGICIRLWIMPKVWLPTTGLCLSVSITTKGVPAKCGIW